MIDERKQVGDQVAQRSEVKHLRIIRVKHFQAPTGDELADMVGKWFRAKKETTYDDDGNYVSEKDLSEQREILDWRYQVTGVGGGEIVQNPIPGISLLPTTTVSEGTEAHHIMLFYAE